MKQKLFMIVLIFSMALQTAMAQRFEIKGTVISKEDGEPLIGVAIRSLENPANGTITDVPASFIEYLSQLGTDCSELTTAQLQEVFADTFMLAVLYMCPERSVPIGRIPYKAQELCYNHIRAFFDQLN